MSNMNKIEPRTLPGFMELLPNEQIIFNQVLEKIKSSYEKFGFLPLDTPALELSSVILAKAGGETEKQIYRFTKGDTDIAMRFDLTVPLAKYVAKNSGELSFPFRRYQIGKVYRGERAQKGRFREFYQADIDIIGDEELSLINDAELPSIIYTTFKSLGFNKFVINLNNRKILNGFFEHLNLSELSTDIVRIVDKIDKIGVDAVKSSLVDLQISSQDVEKILDFISITGDKDEQITKLIALKISNELFNKGLEELQEVIKYVRLFNVPEENFNINLTIARGLDYYTGTVYETFFTDYREIGSVCSGGRYDNLASNYTNKILPGVGISIGVTRLFDQLKDLDLLKLDKKSIADVLVVSATEDISVCLPIANEFRTANINTEVYTLDKKIKNKFKYANKLNIPFIAIIGETEIANNTINLKNLITGEQEEVTLQNAINIIKK